MIIKDPYGFEKTQGMFETLGPGEYIARVEEEEDEVEEDEEKEE